MTMVRVKTADLIGPQLDWAVAVAGEEWKTAHKHFPTMTLDPTFKGVELFDCTGHYSGSRFVCMLLPSNPFRQDTQPFEPSTDWSIGGPIIERERITLIPADGPGHFDAQPVDGLRWLARMPLASVNEKGDTALIAAMRAFVASKLGYEVEVPEVLK